MAGNNLPLLFLASGVLLVAFLFPIEKYPLGFCVFRNLTGYPCPTCGFTRAFCSFINGNFSAGIHDCPFALLLFAATVLTFIYNALAVIFSLFGFRIIRGRWLQLPQKKIMIIFVVCMLLLAANWIYRLLSGLK